MGIHACIYCTDDSHTRHRFGRYSSGDVNLTFTNGHRWVMPDMILHYIADHKWLPLQDFIDDVMSGELNQVVRVQTRGGPADLYDAFEIGYLSGKFRTGETPEGFIEKLAELIDQATKLNMRAQTKGLIPTPKQKE